MLKNENNASFILDVNECYIYGGLYSSHIETKQPWKFRFSFWGVQNGSTPAGGGRTIHRAREGNESKVNQSDDRVIKLFLVKNNNFWAIPPDLFDIFNNFCSFP